jgi:hypothetical protein
VRCDNRRRRRRHGSVVSIGRGGGKERRDYFRFSIDGSTIETDRIKNHNLDLPKKSYSYRGRGRGK